MNESHSVFVYWLMGTFDKDVETLTLTMGVIRSFESVGSALSNGIGAIRIKPMTNLIVAFVLFAVSVPTTAMLTFLVPDQPVDNTKLDDASTDSLESGDEQANGGSDTVKVETARPGAVKSI